MSQLASLTEAFAICSHTIDQLSYSDLVFVFFFIQVFIYNLLPVCTFSNKLV